MKQQPVEVLEMSEESLNERAIKDEVEGSHGRDIWDRIGDQVEDVDGPSGETDGDIPLHLAEMVRAIMPGPIMHPSNIDYPSLRCRGTSGIDPASLAGRSLSPTTVYYGVVDWQ